MRIPIKAAEPLRPEARKRPPSIHVSLQIGWLLTLSRTPVYEAKNRARTAPAVLNRRPATPPNGCARFRLSSTYASRAETVTKNPRMNSAHAPTDIGDQYLKMGPVSPGVTSMSMCQNLNQLAPRSAVSRIGQTSKVAKLA